jgi:hypothetical protein
MQWGASLEGVLAFSPILLPAFRREHSVKSPALYPLSYSGNKSGQGQSSLTADYPQGG